MTLGFSVEELLPHARKGEKLQIGLCKLDESECLQPDPDLSARAAGFDVRPEAVRVTEEAEAPGAELAAMLGHSGGLPDVARQHWEDMCLLTRRADEEIYRLIGAAVAFPTDWRVDDKMGLPLAALHAPIHGFAEQLATGVDRFMAKLKPGPIYGRSNWFVVDSGALCHLPGSRELFAGVDATNAGETLYARCERQTLRRLPQTGAILFTIGVYVQPLASLSAEAIAWLAEAVQAIPPGERERRGIERYLPALLGYADVRRVA
ncbi:heme-dependent oxidative N-demethylase family protein [Qipengyuania sp. CAU 1752]